MRLRNFCAFLFFLCAAPAAAFQIPNYYDYDDFLLAPPGVMSTGLNGFVNPAVLAVVDKPDFQFAWSDQRSSWDKFDRWGLFAGFPNFGIGALRDKGIPGSVTDYRVSFAGGNKGINFGFGYGWSAGDTAAFDRTRVLTLGTLLRPVKQLSLGVVGNMSAETRETLGIADLGLRPFGNEKLTLFTDYAVQAFEGTKEDHWSAGTVLEFVPGIRLTARYFDTDTFTAGVQVSFGHASLSTQGRYNKTREHAYNTYAVRIGGFDKTVFAPKNRFAALDLRGPLVYQRYQLFDNSRTLLGLLSFLDAAQKNDSVGGVVINTSGMQIGAEMLWEIRQKLAALKAAGKRVVVYLEYADAADYYFASIADRVVINPLGQIELKGILFGKFFLKDTLDKVGVGFDEIRLFKYKSAAETLSRTKMSDADREQTETLVNGYYTALRDDICKARGMTPEKFDSLVNDGIYFIPDDALKAGLVDGIALWESTNVVAGMAPAGVKPEPAEVVAQSFPSETRWGAEPVIAVIYAIGPTAMDMGIRARDLVKNIDAAAADPFVKAVVFRVDSPGGSALASDIVAEALLRCKAKKPVVVSQGFVAASGGYWISMYGDPIVTTPLTITGSIGVISGWLYNKGFKEKLGVTTDFVKAGKYADLGFGTPLPFFGSLPDRALSTKERSVMEHGMTSMYKEFVAKVAEGRKKEPSYIESLAQGRIWSGTEAKKNGLADEIGGLDDAIRIAKEKSGIPADRAVAIVELPKLQLLNLRAFTAQVTGARHKTSAFADYLKFRLDNNGLPMPLMPSEFMRFEE